MFKKVKVILSTALVLESGRFDVMKITREQAQQWVDMGGFENFCGHETVRLLGLEPNRDRKTCEGYDQALCLRAKSRLDFGREYTAEEIEQIGVEFILINKVDLMSSESEYWEEWSPYMYSDGSEDVCSVCKDKHCTRQCELICTVDECYEYKHEDEDWCKHHLDNGVTLSADEESGLFEQMMRSEKKGRCWIENCNNPEHEKSTLCIKHKTEYDEAYKWLHTTDEEFPF